jgi:hypothetical protein
MKLISVISARVVVITNTSDLNRNGTRTFPNLTEVITNEYDFDPQPDDAPDTPSDSAQPGIKFKNGQFDVDGQSYRVGLEIYDDGIVAETAVSTQVTEKFLKDVTDWANTNFGLQFDPALVVRTIYNSELSVQFDTPVATAFAPLQKFAEYLTGLPGLGNLPLSLSTLAFGTPSGVGGQPLSVSIERRSNTPVSANIFYCRAPLDTDTHLKALQEFDNFLKQP